MRLEVFVALLCVSVIAVLVGIVHEPDVFRLKEESSSLPFAPLSGSPLDHTSDLINTSTKQEYRSSQGSAGSKPGNGYVLILRTRKGGQLVCGLKSFLSIQCLIGSFDLPMHVVEPFITNSFVHTNPERGPEQLVSFKDLYDFDKYNSA